MPRFRMLSMLMARHGPTLQVVLTPMPFVVPVRLLDKPYKSN
jgi:hypothetical protein